MRRIVGLFEEAGATAEVSSIHVNGWFGDYDKLTMTRLLMRETFGLELDGARERFAFAGDSPNDAPMFAFFPNGVGVANVRRFLGQIETPPAWITAAEGGYGFGRRDPGSPRRGLKASPGWLRRVRRLRAIAGRLAFGRQA